MAEALVSFLVEQLATAAIDKVHEHVRLAVDAKDEVKKLQKTFKTLQNVLHDAEKRQFKDESVKDWLDEFQDVAYDMDDVLDEWRTEIQRLQIEGTPPDENDGKYKHIKEKVSSHLCSPFSCFKKAALYYDIGSKVKEIRERLDLICEEQNKFSFTKSSSQTIAYEGNDDDSSERKTSSIILDVPSIFGRDSDKEILINRLLGESSSSSSNQLANEPYGPRNIISIIGMGGLGKTTLTQLIINDDKVKAHFEKNILWVCVSEPFDRIGIAKAIIQEATKYPTNTSEWNPLHHELINSVQGKRFLLVLDDLWTDDENDLSPLKDLLLHGAPGSRIMLTTRIESVAAAMNSYQYRLGTLSLGYCWSLICRKANFVGTNKEENKVLHDIGFEIAKKCQGLPLAASILGSLMSKQKNEKQWRYLLESEIWELEGVDKKLFKPLLLSYHDLPSPLKRCFVYCAIFPKDHQIRKNKLIKMWMAQGFLNSTSRKKLDIESIGEKYFKLLAERSFFQDFVKNDDDEESIISCKMHDIVHDFALFLSKKQNIDEHEVESSSFPGTLMFEVKNLRSLLVSSKSENYALIYNRLSRPVDLFHHLRCLRVLRLKGMGIEHLPSEIKKLIHLRYLDLSANDTLTELPDSVCSLYNLQTIKLNHCGRFAKLPRGMEKMINLKHLHLRNTSDNLALLPEEIGKLTSLLTLNQVVINGTSGGSKLSVLKDLNLLQGQLKIWGLGKLETAIEASEAELLNKKKGLRLLELDFTSGRGNAPAAEIMENVFGALQPPPNLKRLHISGYNGPTIPVSWFESLTSLRKLALASCFNFTELPALGLLPSLKTLDLYGLNSIERIGFEAYGHGYGGVGGGALEVFPNLQRLIINFMMRLEEFDLGAIEEAAGINRGGEIIVMPRLKEIFIWKCPKLRTLRGLNRLKSLEELKLLDLDNFGEFKSGGEDDPVIINMSLQSLEVRECRNLKSPSLQQLHLPKLNRLTINGCSSLSEKLPTSSPNLTFLEILSAKHSLPPQGLGGFKKLQHLYLYGCSFMTCIPDDIRHLTALQTLEINGSDWAPENINLDCIMEQDEEGWSIMSHIPKVIIKRWCKYELISTLTSTGTRRHSIKWI